MIAAARPARRFIAANVPRSCARTERSCHNQRNKSLPAILRRCETSALFTAAVSRSGGPPTSCLKLISATCTSVEGALVCLDEHAHVQPRQPRAGKSLQRFLQLVIQGKPSGF